MSKKGRPKMEIKHLKLNEITPYENNPRLNNKAVDVVARSIQEYGFQQPIVVDKNMVVIVGHTRLKAAEKLKLDTVPVLIAKDLSEKKAREYRIADNKTNEFAEWDFPELKFELEDLDLDWLGFDFDSEEKSEDPHIKLSDKFIIPPFSVLDTRQGYWQERKKHWKKLINDNGESRFESMGKFNPDYKKEKNIKTGFKSVGQNVSVLDPVLAELVNLWFGLPKSKTFDCFAGDSVFGYVSSYLGNQFTGIELRQEQTDLNNQRIKGFPSKYICDDGQNVLSHIEENSQDLLFSCPPYFDLEVYSDLSNDASNQKEYKDFLQIINNAFINAIKCLKDNRFAVITVGDIRDKKGFYRNFIGDIKNIFINNGMFIYNELILIEQIGTKAITCNRTMINRKVPKVHQNILVFFKGDTKKIKGIYPELDFSEAEYESENV